MSLDDGVRSVGDAAVNLPVAVEDWGWPSMQHLLGRKTTWIDSQVRVPDHRAGWTVAPTSDPKDHRQDFSLDEFECGKTDLLEMHIDTADSPPVKQPPRRIPFAL